MQEVEKAHWLRNNMFTIAIVVGAVGGGLAGILIGVSIIEAIYCAIVGMYNVPHKLDREIRCEISFRK
jgi:hypothetical protein